jgi:hypothetical protein
VTNSQYALTVVIAEENASANLHEIFQLIDPKVHPHVQFIICSASENHLETRRTDRPNVQLLTGSGRIPLLWRDGILAANSDRVALTTAHCLPDKDWINRLQQIRLDDDLVAVGGAIGSFENETVLGSAIYMLRYFSFRPERPAGAVVEIAADNSLYRRSAILQHKDLLKLGFWEPSFHRRFRNEGLELRFDPRLLVLHRNRYTTSQFWSQRVDHGAAFGRDRVAAMSRLKLLCMVVLSPAIPLVFFVKKIHEVWRGSGISLQSIRSSPLMFLFVCGWSLGESKAYWQSFFGRVEP